MKKLIAMVLALVLTCFAGQAGCIAFAAQNNEFRTVNITGGSVNVRSGAGTGYQVVTVLGQGANVRYLEESRWDARGVEWYRISLGGKTGWVSSQYAKVGGYGYVKIVNGSCNVRSLPDLNAKVIGSANQGNILTYLGRGAVDSRGVTWYKVSINGNTGWVSSKYATFATNGGGSVQYNNVTISGGTCTMRKAPNLNGETIQYINSGSVCKYLGEKRTDSRGVAWYKVSFNGKTGWVSSKFAKLSY